MFSGSESEVGSSRINEPFSHRSADLHKLQIQLVSYLAIDPSKSKLVTDTSRSKLLIPKLIQSDTNDRRNWQFGD